MERTQIFDLMGELKLYGMKAAFDEIMATAVKRQHEPQRIVGDLLNAEINEKQARSIKYQLTIAKLPLAKDIADFQFDGTPINQMLVNDLAGGGFIAQQRNVVLVGGTGTGETHLAIAIARSCIRSGARGRFFNVVDLVKDFPAMIPALNAARIDGIDTGMFWTEERSKLMYMVPYAIQAISVVVAPDSGTKIATESDLIGKTSAVEVSSYQMNWLKKLSDASVAKGGAAIEMRTFPTATNVVSALLAGQVDNALLVDSVARDLVGRGCVKEVLSGLGTARTTLGFRNKTVVDAVVKALNTMRADGSYQALFDKCGLTSLPADQPLAIAGPGPA